MDVLVGVEASRLPQNILEAIKVHYMQWKQGANFLQVYWLANSAWFTVKPCACTWGSSCLILVFDCSVFVFCEWTITGRWEAYRNKARGAPLFANLWPEAPAELPVLTTFTNLNTVSPHSPNTQCGDTRTVLGMLRAVNFRNKILKSTQTGFIFKNHQKHYLLCTGRSQCHVTMEQFIVAATHSAPSSCHTWCR